MYGLADGSTDPAAVAPGEQASDKHYVEGVILHAQLVNDCCGSFAQLHALVLQNR